MNSLKRFWCFLKKDTWQSWLVSLVLIIILIRFIFFPLLSVVTGSPLPLVVVESCSMYHESDLESWWEKNSAFYLSKNITKEQFTSFSLKNGLNKGDIVFIWGHSTPKLGDIIVFHGNHEHPLIHRVVQLYPTSTKGDHNSGQLSSEVNIPEEYIIGKSVFKIPLLGWVKLIFFEPFQSPGKRGLCN
tara:strand:+ start:1550 stop:2110 length:561 start_codon:yes stop_codon:yes gene_type:complete